MTALTRDESIPSVARCCEILVPSPASAGIAFLMMSEIHRQWCARVSPVDLIKAQVLLSRVERAACDPVSTNTLNDADASGQRAHVL